MTFVLHGIPNCDQIKKARAWLETHQVSYVFHDFKKAGIDEAMIRSWLEDIGWEQLLNRKGTTWRALPETRKDAVLDAPSAIALMIESPSVVKRPVLCAGDNAYVGFSDELYRQIFKK